MVDDLNTAGDLEPTSDSAADIVTAQELEELEELDDVDVADTPTENKWAARRSLSDAMEDADAEKDVATGTPARRAPPIPAPRGRAAGEEAEEDDEDLDEDEDLEDDEADPAKAAADAAKAQATQDGKDAGKPRYTVKGADGKAFAFELQPGTSIQFQGDGKPVAVTSIDELVQLAQKGVAFDRKTTEQGQTIAGLKQRETHLAQSVAEVRRVAEQTLLAALFDREKRQELRRVLSPYRDPEFRSGQEAKAKLAEQQEQDQQTEVQQVEAKRTEFWTGVGNDIRTELTKFEHLTPDDAMEVATRFHHGYSQAFHTKFAALTATGMPEAEAHADANTHAFTHFTEKNLRRVMRGLNAELAEERASRTKAATLSATPTDSASARATADAHNKKLSDKLEQRKRTPRLQGGGAVPSGMARPHAPQAPRSFRQRMDHAFSLLHDTDDD